MAGGLVNVIKVGLQLVLLPLMARLLGPSEFGLYALALPTVSLLTLLADGGLGGTLARERESNSLIWSSAFWALLLLGIVLALGSSGIGLLMGHLADQPRLPEIIAALSLSLVFLTLTVVPASRLVRRRHLGILAATELAANVSGAVVAVSMAWQGAGAWSLAAQYVTSYAVRAAIVNSAAFQIPSMQFSIVALRPHLLSGGILIASRIFEYSGRAMENFSVDRLFGTAIVGSYNFGNQVSKFVTDSASNVVWSALYVQALTEEKEKVAVLHRQLCRLLGAILFPVTFLAAAAAPEILNVMLGPKWPDLAFVLRVLLPLYAISAICQQTAPLLLAYGRFEIQFWCMVGLSMGRVIAVGFGFWIGLHGALYTIVVVTILYCVAMIVVPVRATGCLPLPMLAGLVRPALCSLMATAAFLLVHAAFPASPTGTLGLMFGAVVLYLLAMLIFDRRGLTEDWNSARRLLSRGGQSVAIATG